MRPAAIAVTLAAVWGWPTARPCPAAEATTRPSGWRGDGSGRSPRARPTTRWDIDEGTNILWRSRVGKSHSTPVVAGGRVLVTAERDWLLCLDRNSGKILWKRDNGFGALPAGAAAAKRYPIGPGGGYSIPTPVTDGRCVYASYATGIVVCYDLKGNRKWIRHIDVPQATEFGRSASPLLADGKLLVSIGGLIALNPRTGKTLWHAPGAKPAYGTPAVARIAGAAVAVTPNGDCVRLADGRIVARKMARTTYTSPIVHAGVVYFADDPTVAVKLPATADGSSQPRRLWKNDKLEGEFFASPIHHDGLLYSVSNEGTLYALDAATGKIIFAKKLDIRSADPPPGREAANIYGSLALAGKHLLLTNDVGTTLVLAPGKAYREVSRNYLDKGSGASPVADGDLLFLRGGRRLYCLAVKAPRRQ